MRDLGTLIVDDGEETLYCVQEGGVGGGRRRTPQHGDEFERNILGLYPASSIIENVGWRGAVVVVPRQVAGRLRPDGVVLWCRGVGDVAEATFRAGSCEGSSGKR